LLFARLQTGAPGYSCIEHFGIHISPFNIQLSPGQTQFGQGVNAQFGPALPTAFPSGQRSASSVHALGEPVQPKIKRVEINKINTKMSLFKLPPLQE